MRCKTELASELAEYLEEVEGMGLAVRHPLVSYFGYEPSVDAMLNEWLVTKKRRLEVAVRERDWDLAIMLHEKPWRLKAFMDYRDLFDDAEYFRQLGDIWVMIENLHEYRDYLPELLAPEGRNLATRRLMMTTDEQAALAALPEVVTVYRGCGVDNEDGWSWTLSEEQGEWFAERSGSGCVNSSGGLLLVGNCHVEDVVAYFNRRDEDEVLMDPQKVTVTSRIAVWDEN